MIFNISTFQSVSEVFLYQRCSPEEADEGH